MKQYLQNMDNRLGVDQQIRNQWKEADSNLAASALRDNLAEILLGDYNEFS